MKRAIREARRILAMWACALAATITPIEDVATLAAFIQLFKAMGETTDDDRS